VQTVREGPTPIAPKYSRSSIPIQHASKAAFILRGSRGSITQGDGGRIGGSHQGIMVDVERPSWKE
jgi:hypothetical protein